MIAARVRRARSCCRAMLETPPKPCGAQWFYDHRAHRYRVAARTGIGYRKLTIFPHTCRRAYTPFQTAGKKLAPTRNTPAGIIHSPECAAGGAHPGIFVALPSPMCLLRRRLVSEAESRFHRPARASRFHQLVTVPGIARRQWQFETAPLDTAQQPITANTTQSLASPSANTNQQAPQYCSPRHAEADVPHPTSGLMSAQNFRPPPIPPNLLVRNVFGWYLAPPEINKASATNRRCRMASTTDRAPYVPSGPEPRTSQQQTATVATQLDTPACPCRRSGTTSTGYVPPEWVATTCNAHVTPRLRKIAPAH